MISTRIVPLDETKSTSSQPPPADPTGSDPLPTVELTLGSSSVSESIGQVSFTLTLSKAASSAVSVPITFTGTATDSGVDYSLSAASLITIPAGQTSVTSYINVVDDAIVESSETVILTMGTPTNATAGTSTIQTLTITDNDLPTVDLTIGSTTAAESVGQVSFTLTLSQASPSIVTVPIAVTGTASGSGVDYSLSATPPISIPAGQTTVTSYINVVDDAVIESSETVILTMGTPTNATAGSSTVQTLTITDNDILALTVASTYPSNGAKWNDYVKYNVASDQYSQSDTACAGTETGYPEQFNGCIHGGEKKKVVVTGITTCTNLTISDALAAFDWICNATSGTAIFYSVGLKPGKGLADLANASSWKNNSVTVQLSGNTIGTSTSGSWWTNPVVPAPANTNIGDLPIILDGVDDDGAGNDAAYAASTIFTIASNQLTSGYIINSDKYSLVTLGTAQLTFNGHSTYGCDYNTGEYSFGGNTTVVCVGGQKFTWVEGTFLGKSDLSTYNDIQIILTSFSRFHNIVARYSFYEVIWMNLSTKNLFKNIQASHANGYSLLMLENSDNNSFFNVRLANNAPTTTGWGGLELNNGSDNNIFYNFNISEISSFGVHIQGGQNNILTKFVISGIKEKGIEVTGTTSSSSRQTLNHFTIANTDRTAMHFEGYVNGSDYGTINQVLLTNQNTYGSIFLLTSNNYIVSQVLAAHSLSASINFSATDNSKVTNNIIVGNTTGCTQGGTNPGITNGCANQGTSDANIIVSDAQINLTNSFVGKVTSDANPSDTAGLANYNTITDFLTFNNFFRSWGLDGSSAFPHTSQRGACDGTSSCRIWDWSLKATDTVARNKSYDGSNANTAFVAGAACPAAVDGNKALTDQQTTTHTFLINAVEIVDDGIGNDNGLCESNEACIYSPNFGAYQGSGNYSSNGTCTFANGTVTGVTMYAYPVNGEP